MGEDRERAEIPTLDARVAALEEQMVALRPRRRLYRDVWLFVVTGLVVLALANANSTIGNLKRDGKALCSFKEDLQTRVDTTIQFLRTHPNGIPGIPAATLRINVKGQQATLRSLGPLVC